MLCRDRKEIHLSILMPNPAVVFLPLILGVLILSPVLPGAIRVIMSPAVMVPINIAALTNGVMKKNSVAKSYQPGEEVLNSSARNDSLLLKSTLELGDA